MFFLQTQMVSYGLKKFERNCDIKEVVKLCKHCSDYTEKAPEIKRNGWFTLYEHYMEVIDNRNNEILSFKIKYCPMCGRNLGDGK
jgi:hypothetical protein